MNYPEFLEGKTRESDEDGFDPIWMPDWLFDFQGHLTEWAIKRGRSAVFADCGLGKGPMQMVWAENVIRKTNRPVLIVAPLAVSRQFLREGEKFGIEINRTRDGVLSQGLNVTNYERLDRFDPAELAGISCDESGVLKHFDTKTRKNVTKFMSHIPYRFLGTATPAPNDYMELGSSSEAIGEMKRDRMLATFFSHCSDASQNWELKGYAKSAYWKWMAKWSRAIRKPSDFGYADGKFELPLMDLRHVKIPAVCKYEGIFPSADNLDEQRREKKESIVSRCEKVVELIPDDRPVVIWCHRNDEGDLLEKLIPDGVQVSGGQSDEIKEERLTAFSGGQIRVMITKPRIGGWGLNWQHCADVFCFASHSYEAFYQCLRRCWRFGQENEVTVSMVYTEAESRIVDNMLRKDKQAIEMYEGIIREMNGYQTDTKLESLVKVEMPAWLSSSRN